MKPYCDDAKYKKQEKRQKFKKLEFQITFQMSNVRVIFLDKILN